MMTVPCALSLCCEKLPRLDDSKSPATWRGVLLKIGLSQLSKLTVLHSFDIVLPTRSLYSQP